MGDIHLDINGNFSVLPYHVLLFNSTTIIYTEIMLHLLIIVPGRIATKKEKKPINNFRTRTNGSILKY